MIARRTLLGLGIATAAALFAAPSTQAATLSVSNGTVYYTADQGERNEVVVTTDTVLGLPVYNFTDGGAAGITLGPGFCDVLNGVGTCSGGGVGSIVINARDADDTIKIATGGPIGPVATINSLIGGRGQDILIGGNGADRLKGNNGRDSLRGRMGADVYRGGRGSDTLQTLDGASDLSISCGPGSRDLIRADRSDPYAKNCELGKQAKPSKRR